jgi:hypothetical protein
MSASVLISIMLGSSRTRINLVGNWMSAPSNHPSLPKETTGDIGPRLGGSPCGFFTSSVAWLQS